MGFLAPHQSQQTLTNSATEFRGSQKFAPATKIRIDSLLFFCPEGGFRVLSSEFIQSVHAPHLTFSNGSAVVTRENSNYLNYPDTGYDT